MCKLNRKFFAVGTAFALLLTVTAGLSPTAAASSDKNVTSVHQPAVEALTDLGIFAGTMCDADDFCGDDPVLRWVMAVWLARIIDDNAPSTIKGSRFADVDDDVWWSPYVERTAEMRITSGCGLEPQRYCPDEPVTRAQMATFLARALMLADGTVGTFSDVGDGVHTVGINALAAAAITAGCGVKPARYCPSEPVTRDQMATFLARAMDLVPLQLSDSPSLLVKIESDSPSTHDGSFDVTFIFGREVADFEANDIDVVNGRVLHFSGSGSTYKATISPSVDGTVIVRVPQGVAHDSEANPNLQAPPLARFQQPANTDDSPGIATWHRQTVARAYLTERHPRLDEIDHEFSGSVADCIAGTTSQAFRDAVIRHVNWYREMSGLDTVAENAEFSVDAQHAALMIAAEGRLSHHPGRDWTCYSPQGAHGASKSNIVYGRRDLGSTPDIYIRDPGGKNIRVGHRRWLLHPSLAHIGTGDVPSGESHGSGNAMYVISNEIWGVGRVRETRGFVAWPPSGFVPARHVYPRWSFSLRGADFDLAEVVVADDDGQVAAEVIFRGSNVYQRPGPVIVWELTDDNDAGRASEATVGTTTGDRCYKVTISGVILEGFVQDPYQYATCLI